jgi:glutamine amidotransferase
MCRLLGIVANQPIKFRLCLHLAPRSLSTLSHEHSDGWGVAVYGPRKGWVVEKSPIAASRDPRFGELATTGEGDVLIGHVRKRTVGEPTLANTHPFGCEGWVFAHNGTLRQLDYLRRRVSPRRRVCIAGETDSELLFAFLLSRLDEVGISERPTSSLTDRVLMFAVQELVTRHNFGSLNFLLSNGDTMYAFRCGRDLHVLIRDCPPLAVKVLDQDGMVLDTSTLLDHRAVLVASEPITDEPWKPIDNGMLLRIDRCSEPEPKLLFHWHNVVVAEGS